MKTLQLVALFLLTINLQRVFGGPSFVNKTFISWSRALSTCDSSSDNAFSLTGTSRLVYAYSDTTPPPAPGQQPQQHDVKGQLDINFGTPNQNYASSSPTFLESDASPLTIQIAPTAVPSGTLYYCQAFELPMSSSSPKLHIVRFEPQIEDDMRAYVHHILIFVCQTLTPEELQYRGNCFGNKVPSGFSSCEGITTIAGWAVGGGSVTLPPEAGLPYAGPTMANRYIMIEIHYNNPNGVSGIVDSSTGFRFWLTSYLRPNDAAMLSLSHLQPNITLPPQQQDILVNGWLNSECTSQKLPPTGIKIFSSMLHTHLTGFAGNVIQTRNGIPIGYVDRNDNYDFNYQQMTPVSAVVLPGDELILNCHYNTMSRTTVTVGGIATTDEMCMSYMLYYPAVDLSIAISGYYTRYVNNITLCAGTNVLASALYSFGTAPTVPSVPTTTTTTTTMCAPTPVNQTTLSAAGVVATMNMPPMTAPAPSSSSSSSSTFAPPLLLLPLNGSSYSNHAILDTVGNYVLHWSIDTSLSIYAVPVIHLAVEVATTGWVGVGVSQTGDMTTSDVVIAWVDAVRETVVAGDRFAVQHALPPLDVSQDVFNVNGVIGLFPVVNMTGVDPIYAPKISIQRASVQFGGVLGPSFPTVSPQSSTSPSSTSSSSSSSSSSPSSLSTSAVIAIAVTVPVCVVLVVAACAFILYVRNKSKKSALPQQRALAVQSAGSFVTGGAAAPSGVSLHSHSASSPGPASEPVSPPARAPAPAPVFRQRHEGEQEHEREQENDRRADLLLLPVSSSHGRGHDDYSERARSSSSSVVSFIPVNEKPEL